MDAYMEVLGKYAQFSGRAGRREYWMFFLINLVISLVLNLASRAIGILAIVSLCYSLAVLIPSIAVGIRRLHDTGKSGWYLLIAFIPILGALALIYFLAQEGDAGENAYGSPPVSGAPAFA